MKVLWFEFTLAFRRLFRRRAQNGLLLVTMAISATLTLISWSLFQTVHLSQPDFDPKGDYYVLAHAGAKAISFRAHSTYDELQAFRNGQTVFSEYNELIFYNSLFIHTPGGEERFLGAYMTSQALQVVGAKPLKGRLFTPDDDKHGAPSTALLSQRMWENSYARDPDIIGKTMTVTGEIVTIVGVLPNTFRFPNEQDLWLSYGGAPDSQRNPMRDAMVKLKPGITPERAVHDLEVMREQLGPNSPVNKYEQRMGLVPLREYYLQPEIQVSSLILFALSLLFVLVSCANAANLTLIDFLGRRSEVAAAMALGIPRAAAMRSVCIQVTLVAMAAAAISIVVLPLAGPVLYERVKFINAPYWLEYHFHWHYWGIALGLAGFCALVTVTAPIVYLWWVNPDRVIREHTYASRGTGRSLWRRGLLLGQIALLTVLGVTAGLLVHSSYNVGSHQWGYPADRVFLAKMSNESVDANADWFSPERLKVHRRALEQIEARPATVATALVSNPPGYSNGPYCGYALKPGQFVQGKGMGEAYFAQVTEDYFLTLDVSFIQGETFAGDTPVDGQVYIVINESLARKLWPGGDALQRTLFVRFPWLKETDPPAEVVVQGVVRDFQANGPTARTNDAIFLPFTLKYGAGSSVHFVVRDKAGVPGTRPLSDALHRADSHISLYYPSTVKAQMDLMLSSMHMTADLTTVFAMAALLLGAIGVYSLTVTQVMQSSREFGIRMALGATAAQLWTGFTRGHLLTAACGVLLGLIGATQVVRVLGSLLYGVDPHNPATYAGVSLTVSDNPSTDYAEEGGGDRVLG